MAYTRTANAKQVYVYARLSFSKNPTAIVQRSIFNAWAINHGPPLIAIDNKLQPTTSPNANNTANISFVLYLLNILYAIIVLITTTQKIIKLSGTLFLPIISTNGSIITDGNGGKLT